jgi:hypothetical protein
VCGLGSLLILGLFLSLFVERHALALVSHVGLPAWATDKSARRATGFLASAVAFCHLDYRNLSARDRLAE